MENSSNEMENSSNKQNVQRLGTQKTSSVVPLVLSDLTIYDEKILRKREFLIKKKLTRGNNRHINEYKKKLPKKLSPGAFSWGVGLLFY